jgi:hypothetical protein
MRVKESVRRLLNGPPRRLIRGALTVALVVPVPALALALWGGGLAKARWEGPASSEVLPFDAPTTTLARARPPERADPASPVAGDDPVLVADRWVPSRISPFR